MKTADLRTGALGLGAVVVLVGTFLPWLVSGSATRNAYSTAGTGGRLLRLDAPTGAVLHVLPFLSLLFVAALVLHVLGWSRSAAGLVLVLDLAVLAAVVGAWRAPSSGSVHVVRVGPLSTGIGAAIGLAAILGTIAERPRGRSDSRTGDRSSETEDAP